MTTPPGDTAALRIAHAFPEALVTAPASALHALLGGPTLFDLPGRAGAPVFVSVLLHGNEHTGLEAVQQVLRRAGRRRLSRPLLLFIGNVAAAAAGVRTLEGQLDFNRAWPGTLSPMAPEARLMAQVADYAARRAPFASLDIHNNTGWNPHYACVWTVDAASLHLARLFSRTIVAFDQPAGVQCQAMARLCPAVTVECGRSGDPAASDHAVRFIEAALSLAAFPVRPPSADDIDLLRTLAIVKVPSGTRLGFGPGAGEIAFREDLDHLNFSEVPAGTSFGVLAPGGAARLQVVEEDHAGPGQDWFTYDDGQIRLARPAIPAMLSTDPTAVRLDCLGYLMRRVTGPINMGLD